MISPNQLIFFHRLKESVRTFNRHAPKITANIIWQYFLPLFIIKLPCIRSSSLCCRYIASYFFSYIIRIRIHTMHVFFYGIYDHTMHNLNGIAHTMRITCLVKHFIL